MDGSVVERHNDLLSSVDVDSRITTAKLTAGTVVVATEGGETHELLGTQYMNLHRLPESLPKVHLVSESLPSDLLNHHVVELATANEFVQPPVGTQYYDDDLLPHDLTEEDKRLAAALVAVQLVQQQKQQHSILATELLNGKTMPPLSPLQTVTVDKPGMTAMVTSYIQAFEDESGQQQLLDHQSHERMLNLYQAQPTTQLPTVNIKLATTKSSKGDSLIESTCHEREELESDYEAECELKTSRRSLPHKKRIPRKLKTQPNRNIHTKSFKCQKCGESFANHSALLAHRSTHSVPAKRSNMFSCEICATQYQNQVKFFEHLKTHYEPNLIQVPNTEITQDHLLNYNTHTEVQPVIQETYTIKGGDVEQAPKIEEPGLTCEQCGRSFKRQKAFDTHVAIAHPQIEEFSEPEDMMEGIRHVVNIQTGTADDDTEEKLRSWRYSDELSIPSDICLDDEVKPTVGSSSFTEMIPDTDTDKTKKRRPKASQCPHCSRVFTHRNSLLYHIRSHSGRRPHQCEVCGKSFFAANALRVHMRMHSGDKPYKCEVCGRSFRQWGDLKYHMTSLHSSQKQYQCEFCGKDFARKYSLIVHRRIHTGEKNYVCEYCRKTFRASSYLLNHRRIHTGEKPYNCDVCQKAFRVKSDMKRHRNTHNKERSIVQERPEPEIIVPDPEPETLLQEAAVPLNLNMRQDFFIVMPT